MVDGSPLGPDQRRGVFPKAARLLSSSEFDRVFAARRSASDGQLIVYALPNGLARPRLGLVVSRKVGNAVTRNRWKRALREAFRLSQADLPPLDLVCIPRSRDEPAVDALRPSLERLAGRLANKLLRAGPPSP